METSGHEHSTAGRTYFAGRAALLREAEHEDTSVKRPYFKRKIDWNDPAQRRKYNKRWMAARRKGGILGSQKYVTILGVRVRVT